MNVFEKQLLAEHNFSPETVIIGCDEAGRGAWAGPIVIAGVILPAQYYNPQIKDSKLLTAEQRATLVEKIKLVAVKYEVVIVPALDVDKLNPKRASIQGMEHIVNTLQGQLSHPACGFIDGEKILSSVPCIKIIKGDVLSQTIAAASILAKVQRDKIMTAMHDLYPEYLFNKNKGYGTEEHRKALEKHSFCQIHRQSYKPIKNLSQQKMNFFW